VNDVLTANSRCQVSRNTRRFGGWTGTVRFVDDDDLAQPTNPLCLIDVDTPVGESIWVRLGDIEVIPDAS